MSHCCSYIIRRLTIDYMYTVVELDLARDQQYSSYSLKFLQLNDFSFTKNFCDNLTVFQVTNNAHLKILITDYNHRKPETISSKVSLRTNMFESKFSQPATDNDPRNFSPSKILGYVVLKFCSSMIFSMILMITVFGLLKLEFSCLMSISYHST